MRKHQFLIVFAALLAAPAASAQVGNAPFCLATDSAYGGGGAGLHLLSDLGAMPSEPAGRGTLLLYEYRGRLCLRHARSGQSPRDRIKAAPPTPDAPLKTEYACELPGRLGFLGNGPITPLLFLLSKIPARCMCLQGLQPLSPG